ncbi:MAG TPA: carboxypeptidase-like regulatory domain-containing protein [Gemmatimonadaceae bacterium]|nr:carboxypeptidase-like regulatory domain-containing protein [Gemmatimonadaceae bacterium]
MILPPIRKRTTRFLVPPFVALLLATVAASSMYAQAQWPKGRARIVGTVVDTATMRPIMRTQICRLVDLEGGQRGRLCASPDTAGRYVFDSLPPGIQVVTYVCSGVRILDGHLLLTDTLRVENDETALRELWTSASSCDMRPFEIRRGTFAGIWTFGFEESHFGVCGGSVPGGWLSLRKEAYDSTMKWPKQNDMVRPSYFLRFEGEIRGPWHYGHMGVSSRQVTVNRLLEVRSVEDAPCNSETPFVPAAADTTGDADRLFRKAAALRQRGDTLSYWLALAALDSVPLRGSARGTVAPLRMMIAMPFASALFRAAEEAQSCTTALRARELERIAYMNVTPAPDPPGMREGLVEMSITDRQRRDSLIKRLC